MLVIDCRFTERTSGGTGLTGQTPVFIHQSISLVALLASFHKIALQAVIATISTTIPGHAVGGYA